MKKTRKSKGKALNPPVPPPWPLEATIPKPKIAPTATKGDQKLIDAQLQIFGVIMDKYVRRADRAAEELLAGEYTLREAIEELQTCLGMIEVHRRKANDLLDAADIHYTIESNVGELLKVLQSPFNNGEYVGNVPASV